MRCCTYESRVSRLERRAAPARQVVMTAGHCCAAGATKAICGGKERPGRKLAESVAMASPRRAARTLAHQCPRRARLPPLLRARASPRRSASRTELPAAPPHGQRVPNGAPR